MIVMEVSPINNKKSRICLDNGTSFVMYKGEIRRYAIREGEELSAESLHEIMHEVLPQRCRARAMHLLVRMDRTQEQLIRKLQEGGYPPEIIEQAVDYVKKYHYVDDARYADSYMRSRSSHKSVRQMQAELKGKGVSDEIIKQTLQQQNVDDSVAIRRLIQKKHSNPEEISREQLQKLYAYLLRRGFKYEDVHRELKLYKVLEN